MPLQLLQHLAGSGQLAPERIDELAQRHALGGVRLDTLLLEDGALGEAALLTALGEVSGEGAVNLADFEPNREVAPLIPPKIAERLCVVPLSVDGQTLHVAGAYPLPRTELEEVAFLLGKKVELWVSLELRVREWISILYGLPPAARLKTLLARVSGSMSAEDVEKLALGVLDEPIPLEVRKPLDEDDGLGFDIDEDAPAAEPAPTPIRLEQRAPPPAGAPPSRQESPPREEPLPAATALGLPDDALPREPARAPEPSRALEPSSAIELPTEPEPSAAPETFELEASSQHEPDARDDAPVRWTARDARAALEEALEDRDQLVDVALRFGRKTFDYVAAFAVHQGNAVGWDSRGEGADRAALSRVSLPLDSPSLFRTVAHTRHSYFGPTPREGVGMEFLSRFGRAPRSAFLFPIEVRSRLVAILYADSGDRPVSQRSLSEFLLFCQELPAAFRELLIRRKRRALSVPAGALDVERPAPHVRPTEAPPALKEKAEGSATSWLAWTPAASSGAPTGLGRAAATPALVMESGSLPPSDFEPLLGRLTGPDPAARARAIAELARTPDASSRALAKRFPGPTAWARLPVDDLPEAEELGPIPGALRRLGRSGAQALAPLLDSDDDDIRYFALLTAGSLPYAELLDGLLRGLFDLEPDISSAARTAAAAYRRLPSFETALRQIRQEVLSTDSLRRSLAARALGALRDRRAVEGLISLTGSDDELSAHAAAEALHEITRASYGTDARRWSMWWAENRPRRRIEWLVSALRDDDESVRAATIDELQRVLHDDLGFEADAPADAREQAVRRWEAFLRQPGPGSRIDV